MTEPTTIQTEAPPTVLVHYHTDPLRCGHCKSTNVKYYDGFVGYEAIRCHDCHIESDLNFDNYNPFPCTCKGKAQHKKRDSA